jgi:hypothetical protein
VELHPEYADRAWKDIPCSLCPRRERPDMSTVAYNDEVHYVGSTTTLTPERFMPEYAEVLAKWNDILPRHRTIVLARLRTPAIEKTDLANMCKVSWHTIYRDLNMLRRLFPSLEQFLG